MAIIPRFFFDAIVALGIKEGCDIKWIGTGFLVGRKELTTNNYTIFLITNYHIVENKDKIFVRFNRKNCDECNDYDIDLYIDDKPNYSKHHVSDIVAIQISPVFLNKNNSEYSWFALDKHALNLTQMKDTDVVEGNIVYSLGFPINMIGANRKHPICRIGCISRISDLFGNPDVNEYLIDLQAIPGYSGAPVINRPANSYIEGTSHNGTANLIGIIFGTSDYSELCDNPECNIEHEKNSGFAVVHPVDAIAEVVEQEYQRRRS